VANLIKSIADNQKYVFVVDHDLSILDFVADYVHIMFGEPSCYGVVSTLYGTLEGINIYFEGYIPADNTRFRDEPYKLIEVNTAEILKNNKTIAGIIQYDADVINFDNFVLNIKETKISSETNMIVIMGKNGTGKSTYLKYLADTLQLNISFKQQINNYADSKLTVQELLYNNIKDAMVSNLFTSDVINLLGINKIISKKIKKLSGGELQRLSIALCLGKPADVYLLDEPSASLDVEYRFTTTKVIKRFMMHNKKIGIIVEHDILMAISLAKEQFSKVLVFSEIKQEGLKRYCETSKLLDFDTGINKFLKSINTTFRTDKVNNRPKINKFESVMDREQKMNENYYF
jgi:ATP-binding cassette subfamily E protein 1